MAFIVLFFVHKIFSLRLLKFFLKFLFLETKLSLQMKNFGSLPLKEHILLGHTLMVMDQSLLQREKFHHLETNFLKKLQKSQRDGCINTF